MNTRHIQLVQSSFALIAPIAGTAANLFYTRLFELDPSLRLLFPEDLQEQKNKFITMLSLAVSGLTRLDEIVPAVQELGRRHARYGVRVEHYDTVGMALLRTLEQGLGTAFTPEVHEAWEAVYTLLATAMQDAAAETNHVTSHSMNVPVHRTRQTELLCDPTGELVR